MGDTAIVFATALVVVIAATPIAGWVSRRLGAVDQPDARRIHTRPTPRLGGLAIFVGILAALGVASQLEEFAVVFGTTSDALALVTASAFIVLLGVVDDVRGVPAPLKLVGQIMAVGVLATFGMTLRFVYLPGNPGTIISLTGDLAVLLTIAVIVAMVNAVNLVDGLDGLAAGIVCIASIAMLVYAQMVDTLAPVTTSSASMVLAALAGACLGFLVYNRHPASIFMGDSGAMLLGLLLGAAGVSAIGDVTQPGRADFAALSIPVLVPALVLALPFLDTVFAILRRLKQRRPMFSPDKAHLHHRLVAFGHSQGRAVVIMWCWSALLAFAAVGVNVLPVQTVGVVLGAGAVLVTVAAFAPGVADWWRRRRARSAQNGAEEGESLVIPFTSSRREMAKRASDLRKRDQ